MGGLEKGLNYRSRAGRIMLVLVYEENTDTGTTHCTQRGNNSPVEREGPV